MDNGSLSCLTNFDRATEYRPVVGYETRYAVNREGQVKSLLTDRILKPGRTSRGYYSVGLYDGSSPKNQKSFLVHQIVAAAWIGPCPDEKQVNHINAVKSDNRTENLEYVTRSENAAHAQCNGFGPRRYKGQDNVNAKLRDDDVVKIKAMLAIGVNSEAIARAFKVSRKLIVLIRDGSSWAHIPDVQVEIKPVA